MNPDNLTDEELRQWIAQKCGYVKRRCDQDYDWREPGGQFTNSLPDYLNSLDAMNDAEKKLETPTQKRDYLLRLADVCERDHPDIPDEGHAMWFCITSTARQRAQAFYLATK